MKGLITVTPEYIVKVSEKIRPSIEGNTVEDWMLSFSERKFKMPNKFLSKKTF